MGSVFKRRGAKKGSPWLYKYKTADDKWVTKHGLPDRESTWQLMINAEKRESRIKAGIIDPLDDQLARPISEHLDEYISYLATKGDTPDQLRRIRQRIRDVSEACDFQRSGDIVALAVAQYLSDRRKSGELTNRTSNAYQQAIKGFCGWMVRTRRLPHNSLEMLEPLRVDEEDVRQRRSASDEEAELLLQSTRRRVVDVRGLGSQSRYWLYQTALWTGFRAQELSSLRRESFALDSDHPTVTLEAGKSKHRKRDVQPILPEHAASLDRWISQHHQAELLWPGGWWKRANEMFQDDLEAARNAWIESVQTDDERKERIRSDFLVYRNTTGEHLDFHALRHTYITRLVRAGLNPKEVQILARHSDIRLTMELYTHLPVGDLYAALARAHHGNTTPRTT
jgi:integrase/recombinase XerD